MIATLYSAKDYGFLTELYLTSDQCHLLEQGELVGVDAWVPHRACRVRFAVYLAHIEQAGGGTRLVLLSANYPRTGGLGTFVEYIPKGRLDKLVEVNIS